MKKVLIVSPVVTQPQTSGNTTRVSDLCSSLQELELDLNFCLCPTISFGNPTDTSAMKKHWGDKYFELTYPTQKSQSIKNKLLNYIKKIAFRYRRNNFTQLLTDFHWTNGEITKQHIIEFDKLVNHLRPQVIIIEYACLSALLKNTPESIIKVVDTHDVFANRNKKIRSEGGDSNWLSFIPYQEKIQLERFAAVIAIQENERNYFNKLLKNSKPKVYLIDILRTTEFKTQTPSENIIGFIGAKSNHNHQGLKLFLDKHWPEVIKKVPDCRLIIAGAVYDDLANCNIENVEFIGRVPTLFDFYNQCKIIINPTQAGSGLKIKSIEALMYGKPLLTTLEGASGLEKGINECIYIGQLGSPIFTQRAIDLLQENIDISLAGQKAIEFIKFKKNKSIQELSNIISL